MISHQPSAASAYLTPSQGLPLHGVLDSPYGEPSTSASPVLREAPLQYSAILPLRGKTLRFDATYTLSLRSLARNAGKGSKRRTGCASGVGASSAVADSHGQGDTVSFGA